jgi:hypothetical protein
VSAPSRSNHAAWLAAGLRRACRQLGVDLPVGYSEAITAEGLAICNQLGVTRLGPGVVIHTAPESGDVVPRAIGYADPYGQWHNDAVDTPP